MDEQQEQAGYYDKLLHHLNKTFVQDYSTQLMNMKAQELFLDLSKHTRTIRFKSIKNIYSTLTEGKADEVIYQKDKEQLISNHVFNQKFTQRTCWRIIQKLITKVSYYLSHEHMLSSLAPSVVKTLAFLRNANQKINNKASFVEFFKEVLDSVIAENNMLEEKIYDLLIKRGYIYSIDEFYRLNRFQGPQTDYMCPEQEEQPEENQEQDKLQVAGKSIESTSIAQSKKSKPRFGISSSKRTMFYNRTRRNKEEGIPEIQMKVEGNQIDTDPQDEINVDEINRLNHNIHQQVQKTVDELLNNQNFSSYIRNNRSQDHVSSVHDPKSSKPSIVRQLLKNLKNRNFQANQKILLINSIDNNSDEQRKNSSKSLLKNKKSKEKSLQMNRTSIAVALNKGMKERIFKSQLQDIEDLIVNNIDRFQNDFESSNFHSKLNKNNILFRSKGKLKTHMIPIHNEQVTIKHMRRSSNFQFLSGGFNFHGLKSPRTVFEETKRLSNFGYDGRISQTSSNRTIQTPAYNQKLQFVQRYVDMSSGKASRRSKKLQKVTKDSHLSSGNQIVSRFASEFRQFRSKQNRFFFHSKKVSNAEQLNPTLLKIIAEKYSKCVTQQPEELNSLQLKQLNILAGLEDLENLQIQSMLKDKSRINMKQMEPQVYHHDKRYEVYDRKHRRML